MFSSGFDLENLVSGSYPHIFIKGLELYNDEFKEDFLSTYEQSITVSHHMGLLKKAYKPDGVKGKHGFVCVPIYKYEHSLIYYSLAPICRFDSSVIGACILRKKELDDLCTELNLYSQWVNGEIYSFDLYDHINDTEDSCCGFFNFADMKDALPDYFKDKDLSTYISY